MAQVARWHTLLRVTRGTAGICLFLAVTVAAPAFRGYGELGNSMTNFPMRERELFFEIFCFIFSLKYIRVLWLLAFPSSPRA